jgi:D-hydroxyproline dehydrogenase subunit gamma
VSEATRSAATAPLPASSRRLPLHGDVARGARLTVEVNGESVGAFAGESVAALLMAQGDRTFRTTGRTGSPRGLYCGMGVCYDCLVVVDDRANTRACMTEVAPGMRIQTQQGAGPSS